MAWLGRCQADRTMLAGEFPSFVVHSRFTHCCVQPTAPRAGFPMRKYASQPAAAQDPHAQSLPPRLLFQLDCQGPGSIQTVHERPCRLKKHSCCKPPDVKLRTHCQGYSFISLQPLFNIACCKSGERERERERERVTTSIQPAYLMRTGLCSCLGLLQQGNETMADRLLVLVPHEQTHAPGSILEQARELGSDVTEMGAIEHTMELIAHSLCITNSAPPKVARDGWPGKTALLNGQSMGTPSC